MEFVLKEDFTLLPDTIEHIYQYGPWDVDVSHMSPITTIEVKRNDDPLQLLAFRGIRNSIDNDGFTWTCEPGIFMAMRIPQDFDVLANTALEAKTVLPEVEAFVLALIAS
ncbi:hypothetical protein VJ918_07850 [Adlercreutzia sp. R21]|uniref:Uncharacterized protein n=1 Tax=Adlercreutzia wanghongyangiae TaxID=3111451 RepID=A0ABU6IKQ1_9ACTN|nr:hypothetical protein [Adlercreutzia sp. R21]MEC4177045.1 hypothetical protein [Adlercreutzia sp. R7]MEC4184719.1 hypothetical protein [Adlercreutzia sp. R21]